MFTYAIARRPAINFDNGITTANLGPPNFNKICHQHNEYIHVLKSLGLVVEVLAPLKAYPDAYFVEDTAVVTPKVAVIARPGADARQGEAVYIEPFLASHRPIERITSPATLDGGDVLMVDTHFFIGTSDRTNHQGAQQLGSILERYGYTWSSVEVTAGLHLKSSVNYIGDHTLLATDDFALNPIFNDFTKIVLKPAEAYAANTLWINGRLIMPAGFPTVKAKLNKLSMPVIELDISEVRKMDGGLTCMSIRF